MDMEKYRVYTMWLFLFALKRAQMPFPTWLPDSYSFCVIIDSFVNFDGRIYLIIPFNGIIMEDELN